jgi:orotate phosphoribosyltransferase
VGTLRFDVPFTALLEIALPTYEPGTCPLCARGLPVVKPGSRPVVA